MVGAGHSQSPGKTLRSRLSRAGETLEFNGRVIDRAPCRPIDELEQVPLPSERFPRGTRIDYGTVTILPGSGDMPLLIHLRGWEGMRGAGAPDRPGRRAATGTGEVVLVAEAPC
jgi:hypothetical protein